MHRRAARRGGEIIAAADDSFSEDAATCVCLTYREWQLENEDRRGRVTAARARSDPGVGSSRSKSERIMISREKVNRLRRKGSSIGISSPIWRDTRKKHQRT